MIKSTKVFSIKNSCIPKICVYSFFEAFCLFDNINQSKPSHLTQATKNRNRISFISYFVSFWFDQRKTSLFAPIQCDLVRPRLQIWQFWMVGHRHKRKKQCLVPAPSFGKALKYQTSHTNVFLVQGLCVSFETRDMINLHQQHHC